MEFNSDVRTPVQVSLNHVETARTASYALAKAVEQFTAETTAYVEC